jgi:hypothetical protein
MPVILRPEDEEQWLDASRTSFAKAQSLLKPYPEELMDAHDVSPIVNSAKYDGPECIQPVSDDEMPRAGQLSLLLRGLLLIAPSLHALIENLPLVASASKGGLTLALVQVAVTIFVNLTLGGVAQS